MAGFVQGLYTVERKTGLSGPCYEDMDPFTKPNDITWGLDFQHMSLLRMTPKKNSEILQTWVIMKQKFPNLNPYFLL